MTRVDLNNLDGVEDLASLRAALRSALEQARSDSARLREWETKAEELEGSRKGFVSLMSQLSESRRLVAEAREEMLRMKHEKELAENRARLFEMEKEACAARLKDWESKAADLEEERRKNLLIVAQIPGGADAREALLRMAEAKSDAENKARFLELEKEACASRLREWEGKAADFESLQRNLEERESLSRAAKKSLGEKEAALEKHALELEAEYARKRKELDEFKERLKAEINELKPREGRDGR
ncbi:MAG: hypothetical protein A3J79_01630 [Elusimicrobia bacterium RIFOXYB2_FULL_62_6]|nr:MAG: hypothetical protein A3J79_01630 [Elusimicrobia bacterium RIFOXYB2_FULL_62_6]